MKKNIPLFIAVFSCASVQAQFRSITQPAPIRMHQSFNASSSFSVPSGVKRLFIKAWGAGGGGGGAGFTSGSVVNPGGDGGAGGFASAIVPVSSGMAVDIHIEGGGAKGLQQNSTGFGGSGGGDVWVNVDALTVVNVGAGGGGGGGDTISALGGKGGNGGGSAGDSGNAGTTSLGGGSGSVDQSTATATHGAATNMAATCPASTTKANPTSGSSTGVGGICFQTAQGAVFATGSIKGGGKYGTGALSRPSGGGGGAGGWAFGGGGQGTASDGVTAGSGAGGGGGGTLVNSFGITALANGINLKSAAGVTTPPVAMDGDYNGIAGKGGSGQNVTGALGGDGGPPLVVIYFLYN